MSIQVVKLREFTGHTQAVYTLCHLKEENHFLSAGADGMIVKWHIEGNEGLLIARDDAAIYSVFANEEFIISGNSKGKLTLIEKNGKSHTLKISDKPVFCIYETEKGIAVLSGDGCISVLNTEKMSSEKIKISDKSLRCMISAGNKFAVGSSDGHIYMLDGNFAPANTIKSHSDTVFSLLYSDHHEMLISGSKDAHIHFHNSDGNYTAVAAHNLHVNTIALTADGNRLLSGSMDKSIRVWDVSSQDLLKVINAEKTDAHKSSVNKILWFGKNNFISCSDDRSIMCFEITEKEK